MTNVIKIYSGKRLVHVINRNEIIPAKRVKAGIRQSTGMLGSNQYQKKRKSDYKRILSSYFVSILIFAGIVSVFRHFTEPKIISPLPVGQAYAEVKVSDENPIQNLINPIPSKSPDYKDIRVKKVYNFLLDKNSPLSDYAEYIVTMADKYDIPWTLVTAIAGKESSFETAGDTTDFNAWGIMTWDDAGNRSIREFKSWKESITYATSLISKNYRHNMNSAIQAKYCPSFECSDTWTKDVTHFQEAINE